MGMTQPHRSMLRTAQFAAIAALLGCAPVIEQSQGDGPGRQSAFFESFPTLLFASIASRCQADTDRLTRPSQSELICESLPTPEAAAALILEFDGDVEELPVLVTTLSAEEEAGGFAVTTEYYYLVPQRSGEVAEIRFAEPRVQRTIRRALSAAGGVIR